MHSSYFLVNSSTLVHRLINAMSQWTQLTTFLYFARTRSDTRILQEHFQWSLSTISGYVHLFSILYYYHFIENTVQLRVSSMFLSQCCSIPSMSKHLSMHGGMQSGEIVYKILPMNKVTFYNSFSTKGEHQIHTDSNLDL